MTTLEFKQKIKMSKSIVKTHGLNGYRITVNRDLLYFFIEGKYFKKTWCNKEKIYKTKPLTDNQIKWFAELIKQFNNVNK